MIEAPLLFETGVLLPHVSATIVVGVESIDIQISRIKARNPGLSEQDIRQRIAAQLPLEEKQQRCSFYIDNSGSLDALNDEVSGVWKQLLPSEERRQVCALSIFITALASISAACLSGHL